MYVQNNPVNYFDSYGLYDESDFLFEGLTGETSEEYHQYEEQFKKEVMEEAAAIGGCVATCVVEYYVGDINQKGGKKVLKQFLKSAVKVAVLSKLDKGITYWSIYGLVTCTGSCCNE